MVSILVADDHGIVREGLKRVLESEPDLRVCAEASDGSEVLEQVEKHRPDVVLLDITMPKLGGLEALEQLRAKRPELRVLLLSMHGERSLIKSAVSLGADGYLLKNAPPEEVITAVRAVAKGGSFFSPPVAREIVDQLRASTQVASKDPFELLSVREREVLVRIADGLSAKEIASELEISTKTVEAHRTSLMRKLGTKKATALVRYALRHGLVKP